MASGNNALLGEVGMGTTFLGGLSSAISSFVGGEAQQQMYNYQAGVATLNAQIMRQNATYATQVGENQAMRAGLAGAQTQGRLKASLSTSGLDINTGSGKQALTSQSAESALTQTAIRSNAAKTAYNYENEAVGFSAQANADTIAGKNARMAGLINAGSSLLSSATSVSSEWLKGQQLGLWGSPA